MYTKITHFGGQALHIFNRHWFKIGLGFLGLYAFLSRDFSFKISIQAPVEVPVKSSKKADVSRKEILTDNGLSSAQTSNQFDFLPSWRGSESMPLIEQLKIIDSDKINVFIRRFTAVARAEQERFGIPASIILAHSLLKSGAGASSYVKTGNNYFSLFCADNWDGGTQDGFNGCLRRYDNAWQSFRDHSLYLTTGVNAGLNKIGSADFKIWAKALGQLNKTEDNFEQQLLVVIREFDLERV